jgi:hypothetical protein
LIVASGGLPGCYAATQLGGMAQAEHIGSSTCKSP